MSRDSRLPGFYRKSVPERIEELQSRGLLSAAEASRLASGQPLLPVTRADRMIENVIGCFGLPFAIAGNFVVDGRDYLVPMVVEEPSIVAGLSAAARLVRRGGGFRTSADESLLAGQIHLVDITDVAAAGAAVNAARDELLAAANDTLERLVARGGGARDLTWRALEDGGRPDALVVDIHVDTCDAMGANLVNGLAEALAPRLEQLTGGHAALRILSNYADRARVRATASIPLSALRGSYAEPEAVRDGIVTAAELAVADPWRAATHNKGIMNGIDAVAIATGNDWRAIEAGAHAYAAASGRYQPLSRWAVGDDGALLGTIDVPLKPGIVGGSLEANPGARLGLDVCAVSSASELAALMAAVGLAQNLAALRALATHGIQHGHMRLHARSVAASAGVPRDRFDAVVAALVESGEIKIWKAREIVAGIDDGQEGSAGAAGVAAGRGESNGKVILLGEHAAVYDKHVLAVPLPGAMRVDVSPASSAHTLNFRGPRSSGNIDIGTPAGEGMVAVIDRIREQLALDDRWFSLSVRSRIPPGMGLGASAAFAVAAIRALAACYGRELSDEDVNALAFDCEKLSHGTPSGIDNTLATFGAPVLFRKQAEPPARVLDVPGTLPIVVGYGSEIGATIEQVAGVRKRRSVQPAVFDAIFAEIDRLSQTGTQALLQKDFATLGATMNVCHGLLNAIGVSTPSLERMVSVAREAGAAGAKLTGAGGGGSIVALCPDGVGDVADALRAEGFDVLDANSNRERRDG